MHSPHKDNKKLTLIQLGQISGIEINCIYFLFVIFCLNILKIIVVY